MEREALKMALEALESGEKMQYGRVGWIEYDSFLVKEAITAIKAALAQPAQEPIGTLNLGAMIYTSEGLEYDDWDVELSSKTIEALQERLVTSDPVTLNIYTTPQERNFCPRCGKRTADLTVIHTCTPPQENT
jgi:hypothetical protein